MRLSRGGGSKFILVNPSKCHTHFNCDLQTDEEDQEDKLVVMPC